MRELVYKVCCTKNDISFYLLLIGSVLKHCKLPKYYDQDFLKNFFSFSALPMMIEIFGKNVHLV